MKQFLLSLSLIVALIPACAKAATIPAASAAYADVNAAVTAASSGDTVTVPSGNVTWLSTLALAGKAINLVGNGSNNTIIANGITGGSATSYRYLITFSQHATLQTKIAGFQMTGAAYNQGRRFINASGDDTKAAFRIYTNHFVGDGNCTFIVTSGQGIGCIDSCVFLAGGAAEMIHNEAYGSVSTAGWAVDVIPGSSNALYIEGNIFRNYQPKVQGAFSYDSGSCCLQSYYGARTVLRNNLLIFCQTDQHGTTNSIGARWWEIYNNTNNIPMQNGGQDKLMGIRAGSGVIYNNVKTGFANISTGHIVLYEEPAPSETYPALYQIGRGKLQALFPAFSWNNTLPDLGTFGDQNFVQVNRDFFLTPPTYSYVPLTYPNPLRGAAIPSPPLITSATVQANGSNVVLTATESVSFGAGGSAGFGLSMSAGTATLTYVSGTGSSSNLTFATSRFINPFEFGTLTYTQPGNGWEDADGSDLASFTGYTILNLSSTNNAPRNLRFRSN